MYTIYNGLITRWSGKKKAVVFGSVLLVLLLFVLCLLDRTVTRSCVMMENDAETDAVITVSYKGLIGAVTQRLHGKVTVQAGDRELEFQFADNGATLFDLRDCKVLSVTRSTGESGEEGLETGALYFDNRLEHMALITSRRRVYAADSAFMEVLDSRELGPDTYKPREN